MLSLAVDVRCSSWPCRKLYSYNWFKVENNQKTNVLLGHVNVICDEENSEIVVDRIWKLEKKELVKMHVEVVDQDPTVFFPAI